jgi:hypothetical protein
VYAKSEPFELKPQGTPPVMPYGINAETAVAGAQGASGGVRRVPLFSMSMISSAWVQAGVAGLAVWFLR